MNTPRGEHAHDQLLLVELVDADPSIFAPEPPHPATPREPKDSTRVRLTGVLVALTVLAAAVALWEPWNDAGSEWRTYPVAGRFTPTLSARLVLDEPPGIVVDATAPQTPLAPAVTRSTLIGHVFAEPGATEADGRWAMFSSLPSWSLPSSATSTQEQVAEQTVVEWGPVSRRSWTARTHGMNRDDTLAFTKAVGVVDEQPALRIGYDMGGLRSIGGVEAFQSVVAVRRVVEQRRAEYFVEPTVVRYQSADGVVSLLSIPAPPDTMPLVRFLFAGPSAEVTVRGVTGIVVDWRPGQRVLTWLEGGRLVMLVGPQPADRLVGLATTVRAAGDAEWDAVLGVRTPPDLPEGSWVELGDGGTPNGARWRVYAAIGSPSTAFCLTTVLGQQCTTTTGRELPTLDDWYVLGGRISVRFSTVSTPATAVVTTTDATIMRTPFVQFDGDRTAVAVFVPSGARLVVTN